MIIIAFILSLLLTLVVLLFIVSAFFMFPPLSIAIGVVGIVLYLLIEVCLGSKNK